VRPLTLGEQRGIEDLAEKYAAVAKYYLGACPEGDRLSH